MRRTIGVSKIPGHTMAVQDRAKRCSDRTPSAINADLAEVIGRWTAGKQDCLTPVPNLFFFRREVPTDPCACTVEPSVLFVVQGAKQLLIGEQSSGLFLSNPRLLST